eukprot:m.24365 g.24365  ORF g.24365 m.24365 type:complete len:1617 (+) comp13054_c0_seq1:616-5466(+)
MYTDSVSPMYNIVAMNDDETMQHEQGHENSEQVFIKRSRQGLGVRVSNTTNGHGVHVVATEPGSHAESVFGRTENLRGVRITHVNEHAVMSRDVFIDLVESTQAADGVRVQIHKARHRTASNEFTGGAQQDLSDTSGATTPTSVTPLPTRRRLVRGQRVGVKGAPHSPSLVQRSPQRDLAVSVVGLAGSQAISTLMDHVLQSANCKPLNVIQYADVAIPNGTAYNRFGNDDIVLIDYGAQWYSHTDMHRYISSCRLSDDNSVFGKVKHSLLMWEMSEDQLGMTDSIEFNFEKAMAYTVPYIVDPASGAMKVYAPLVGLPVRSESAGGGGDVHTHGNHLQDMETFMHAFVHMALQSKTAAAVGFHTGGTADADKLLQVLKQDLETAANRLQSYEQRRVLLWKAVCNQKQARTHSSILYHDANIVTVLRGMRDCEGWDMMLDLLSEKREADAARGVHNASQLPEIAYLHAYALYQRNHGNDREESYSIIKALCVSHPEFKEAQGTKGKFYKVLFYEYLRNPHSSLEAAESLRLNAVDAYKNLYQLEVEEIAVQSRHLSSKTTVHIPIWSVSNLSILLFGAPEMTKEIELAMWGYLVEINSKMAPIIEPHATIQGPVVPTQEDVWNTAGFLLINLIAAYMFYRAEHFALANKSIAHLLTLPTEHWMLELMLSDLHLVHHIHKRRRRVDEEQFQEIWSEDQIECNFWVRLLEDSVETDTDKIRTQRKFPVLVSRSAAVGSQDYGKMVKMFATIETVWKRVNSGSVSTPNGRRSRVRHSSSLEDSPSVSSLPQVESSAISLSDATANSVDGVTMRRLASTSSRTSSLGISPTTSGVSRVDMSPTNRVRTSSSMSVDMSPPTTRRTISTDSRAFLNVSHDGDGEGDLHSDDGGEASGDEGSTRSRSPAGMRRRTTSVVSNPEYFLQMTPALLSGQGRKNIQCPVQSMNLQNADIPRPGSLTLSSTKFEGSAAGNEMYTLMFASPLCRDHFLTLCNAHGYADRINTSLLTNSALEFRYVYESRVQASHAVTAMYDQDAEVDTPRASGMRVMLGEGRVSSAYLGVATDEENKGKKVVVKVLNDFSDAASLAKFNWEISVLRQLKHDNIIQFMDVCQIHTDGSATAYLRLHVDATLSELVTAAGPLFFESVAPHVQCVVLGLYTAQLLSAVEYLHERFHFQHCNIHTDNVLVDTALGKVVLSGFGQVESSAASPHWLDTAPPSTNTAKRTGSSEDVVQLGATVWAMASGDISRQAAGLQLAAEIDQAWPESLQRFISACLTDARTRPTVAALRSDFALVNTQLAVDMTSPAPLTMVDGAKIAADVVRKSKGAFVLRLGRSLEKFTSNASADATDKSAGVEYGLEIGLLIDIVVELLASYDEEHLERDALRNLSNLASGELSPQFQLGAYMDRLCDFVSMLECLGPAAVDRSIGKHVLLDMLRVHNEFAFKPHLVWTVQKAFDSVIRQAKEQLMPGASCGSSACRRGSRTLLGADTVPDAAKQHEIEKGYQHVLQAIETVKLTSALNDLEIPQAFTVASTLTANRVGLEQVQSGDITAEDLGTIGVPPKVASKLTGSQGPMPRLSLGGPGINRSLLSVPSVAVHQSPSNSENDPCSDLEDCDVDSD